MLCKIINIRDGYDLKNEQHRGWRSKCVPLILCSLQLMDGTPKSAALYTKKKCLKRSIIANNLLIKFSPLIFGIDLSTSTRSPERIKTPTLVLLRLTAAVVLVEIVKVYTVLLQQVLVLRKASVTILPRLVIRVERIREA